MEHWGTLRAITAGHCTRYSRFLVGSTSGCSRKREGLMPSFSVGAAYTLPCLLADCPTVLYYHLGPILYFEVVM